MSRFQTINEFQDENNVKVVVDNASNALYFSRQPIPSPWKGFCKDTSFMQTGIIGFRRQCLLDFNMSEETRLEQIESVDMNRVLELGGTVRMSLMQGKTIGVDVPGDLEIAATHMHGDDAYKLYSSNDSKGTV
jgi:3-deoxy-manno-octulosonate cytidylyltransferase (CMP-KDO synthetase)